MSIRTRMNATGIGFAGIEGVWWLPAAEPFPLPVTLHRDLEKIGSAIFTLFDVVMALYGTTEGATSGLNALLEYRVPPQILRLAARGKVLCVRPDFQLVPIAPTPGATAAPYQLVATELEICPSAHGYAHAMQVGYGLPADLVQAFVEQLAGRELLFVGTAQWSEFLFEQLAFCRALAEAGGRGRVLYDLPIHELAASVHRHERWQPPIFGVKTKPTHWDDDIEQRLDRHRLRPFLWPAEEGWPQSVGKAVVFRFGYFDCFAPDTLRSFLRWQARGATLQNPATYILDSKVILATLQLPAVRERINRADPAALAILDRCIPETHLLTPATAPTILANQADWVVKFAGYDSGQQAWGGRSLQIGASQSQAKWREVIQHYLALPWPVVAQRVAPSARVDIAYLDAIDQMQWMYAGYTRLRVFLLRHGKTIDSPPKAVACGAHITVTGGSMQVSEATDAVQAPVAWG